MEWNDRSVGNLHDGDGNLRAILKSDADKVTFFMAQ
jgi:hypothetical protein